MKAFRLFLLASVVLITSAGASDPTVTKLHARGSTDPAGNNLGEAVAVSDAYLLAGERLNDDVGLNGGAAHLYDARTGRHLRKLLGADTNANDEFGSGVALGGNLVVIGSPGEDGGGAVYGFDAQTGRQLWKLENAEADTRFGSSVAVDGSTLVVGAPEATDNGQSNSGVAYLYDVSGGPPVLRTRIERGGDARFSDLFGSAVAVSGRLAVIGSQDGHAAQVHDAVAGARLHVFSGNTGFGRTVAIDGRRVLVSDRNNDRIRVFDALTGDEASFELPATNLGFRNQVAVSGNLAAVPASNGNQVSLFDLTTGKRLRILLAPGGASSFASAVALCGNRLVIGAHLDDDLGIDAGAAYYFRDVSGPFPMATLAKTGDFAPGTVGADFLRFGDTAINPNGLVSHLATAAQIGTGATQGGIWTNLLGPLRPFTSDRQNLGGGLLVNRPFLPVMNLTGDIVFQGTLSGSNVHRGNDAAILNSAGGNLPSVILREDQNFEPQFNGARLGAFLETVQPHGGTGDEVAVAFRHKLGPGGVALNSDSGVLAVSLGGQLRDAFQEDYTLDSLPNVAWGQFSPRVSMTGTQMLWSAALVGSGTNASNNQGLFRIDPGVGNEVLVARRGDGFGNGTTIRAFLGEAINPDNQVAYRCSLDGGSASEREKLVYNGAAPWTKGDLALEFQNPPRITSLLKFWPIRGGKLMFLGKLSGPGITRNNDCGLWAWESPFAPRLMLQEGDLAPGCDGARIGVIQRVAVEPENGGYVILTSLTGNPAANQALLTGFLEHGNHMDQFALRSPVLSLRKGTSYQAPGGTTTRILSMSLPETADRTGAGAKGGPQVISEDGEIILCVQFADRSKHLVTGRP
jgi:outer membrane protein assembly factor BamB